MGAPQDVYKYGVKIGGKIGTGAFGAIYKGTWQGVNVALKRISDEGSERLLKEAEIMIKLRHPNIVAFYGIYKEGESEEYLVTEYVSQGDLHTSLKKGLQLSLFDVVCIARGAAAGMMQLEDRRIVHRDLACRNLLLERRDDTWNVKVSDFGLSDQRNKGSSMQVTEGSLPVRWTAPEAIKSGSYTSKSDMWSFGVTIWEVLNNAALPYEGTPNAKLLQHLEKGNRLKLPDVPKDLKNLLVSCWNANPDKRPSFKDVFNELDRMAEESDAALRRQGVGAQGEQGQSSGESTYANSSNAYAPEGSIYSNTSTSEYSNQTSGGSIYSNV